MSEFYVKILSGFKGVACTFSVPARVWPSETAPQNVKDGGGGYQRAVLLEGGSMGALALMIADLQEQVRKLEDQATTALLERDDARSSLSEANAKWHQLDRLRVGQSAMISYWKKEVEIARDECNRLEETLSHL